MTFIYFYKIETRRFIDFKCTFFLKKNDFGLHQLTRNIPNAQVISANELSTYELVNADYIVLFESAIYTIENRLN